VRGESGVAGEGRVVGVPKLHSWGKCTMPLTNINSDWMPNASSSLRINFCYLCYLYCADPLSCTLGCNITSITAPQDAHKRLVMQVAEWLTASL